MELLVPAGDINSFYAALNNGADAIYLSGCPAYLVRSTLDTRQVYH